MKLTAHIKLSAIILVIMCLLSSCKDEQDLPSAQGQLQLKIQPADLTSSSGRITTDMTPDAIVLTLVGNGTETRKTLDLIDFSGEYTTNPISLSVGNYEVTEFIVTNSDDEVIYAVPRKDSEFGSLVSQPLPISITINSEQVLTLAPQVISVAGKTASEFGYASFGFDVLPSFRITTMGMVDGVAELITPRLVLTQASDTLLDYELEDAINEVPYVDNGSDLRLTLMQHGFARYSQVFSADSLANFSEEPLFIILEKAFTFEMSANDLGNISFDLGYRRPSIFNIDWGNNIDFDTLRCKQGGDTIKAETVTPFKENFNKTINFISITGDFENIAFFNNKENRMSFIYLSYLKKLEVIELKYTELPELDISSCQVLEDFYLLNNNNEQMKSLDFSNLPNLQYIAIREKNLENINLVGSRPPYIDLVECINFRYPFINQETDLLSLPRRLNIIDCKFNTRDIESLMKRIEEAVIATQSRNGQLYMYGNAHPFGKSLEIINNLRTNYGWAIGWE